MVNDKEYELVQDDEIVAATSGTNAFNEIYNYAAQYGQDGPVEIYEVTRRKIDPAAAPQVVADERNCALSQIADDLEEAIMNFEGDLVDTITGCIEEMRAVLAAAPVQAQESIYQARSPEETAWQDIDRITYDHASANGFEVRRVYRAPVQPVAVPDGWKLVPVEPTDEMRMATIHSTYHYEIDADWAAMLAAVPAAPAAQGDPLIDVRLADAKAEIKYWKEKATAAQGDAKELTDAQIDAVFEAQEAKYGQVCDSEDMRMFARAIILAAIAAKAAS